MRIVTFLEHPDVPAWTFTQAHAERLRAALPGASVTVCHDEAAFLAALPEATVALVWRFEQAWLERAPHLRHLFTPAAGRDYFRLEPRPGLRITYGSFHGRIMGETVAALLLAEFRGVAECLRRADEPWPVAAVAPRQRTLRGAHVVILGFGHIGEWIGRLLKPFGVRLTGVRRRPGRRPAYFDQQDLVISAGGLDAVLHEADALVLALPGGPETDRILDARRLALLPSRAVLCNVGRGNAVDHAALAEALVAGRLAAACLDVFAVEPLPADAPLRRAPHLTLMPHISAVAPEYLDLFLDEVIAELH